MNRQTSTEIWWCEDCHAVETTTVAWEDRDVYSVLYAIEDDHHRVSPQCQREVRRLRVINRAVVKRQADLEADASVPCWVIEPVMRLLDATPVEQAEPEGSRSQEA